MVILLGASEVVIRALETSNQASRNITNEPTKGYVMQNSTATFLQSTDFFTVIPLSAVFLQSADFFTVIHPIIYPLTATFLQSTDFFTVILLSTKLQNSITKCHIRFALYKESYNRCGFSWGGDPHLFTFLGGAPVQQVEELRQICIIESL